MYAQAATSHISRDTFPEHGTLVPAGTDIDLLVEEARHALTTDLVVARNCLDQISQALKSNATMRVPKIGTGMILARSAGPVKGGLASWQLRKIDEFIDRNLANHIRIGALSEITRISNGHFCRAFKTTTGETPHNYVRRRRLERAQAMMLNTAEPLSQIAAECGLADQSHLTRLFRKFVGQTPLTWRRTWMAA